MTNQPDPSRSSIPRHGSVVPSSTNDDATGNESQSPPVVPKLRTITPSTRRQEPDPSAKKASEAAANHHSEPSRPSSPGRPNQDEKKVARRKAHEAVNEEPLQPKKRWKPLPDPLANFPNATVAVDLDLVSTAVEGLAEPSEFETVTIRDRIEKNRHPLSSFLISLSVHVAIFLALALIAFTIRQPTRQISIVASIDSTPTPNEPAQVEAVPIEIDIPNEEESPIDMAFEETSVENDIADTSNTEIVAPNMLTSNADPVPAETDTAPTESGTLPTGGGLEGRTGETRASLAASMGGTRESELAVELGLKWIIKHQRKNGSWHFYHDAGQCNGECGNQGEQEATTAATGMALMALLGAGYTHKNGKYQQEVQAGLDYLIRTMHPSGSLTSGETKMYAHAIATIALSEALTMTNDSGLAGPVDLARKYIERAQHKKGGWRYNPGQKGDLSVSGWQIMALKSCHLSGFETGEVVYAMADEFVDSMAAPSQGYGYLHPGELPTMTAVGVLSKMYLGAELNEGTLEQSTRFLADCGPSKTDMYFNFYATQVLHHRHDDAWADWNNEQRDYLIGTQDNSGTHSSGSWYFPDHHGRVGGRLYTTAMAVMILEVYYRYLPLYEEEAVKTARVND